jgi:hypothetical protein
VADISTDGPSLHGAAVDTLTWTLRVTAVLDIDKP